MQTVTLLAKLIAFVFGFSFEDEWACWEDLVEKPKYVCEHRDSNHLYRVESNDGKLIFVRFENYQ